MTLYVCMGMVSSVQYVYTVNHEYFAVKIFLDSLACAKIKRTKYMRNINGDAVQGRLSENYLTRNLSHEIIIF